MAKQRVQYSLADTQILHSMHSLYGPHTITPRFPHEEIVWISNLPRLTASECRASMTLVCMDLGHALTLDDVMLRAGSVLVPELLPQNLLSFTGPEEMERGRFCLCFLEASWSLVMFPL